MFLCPNHHGLWHEMDRLGDDHLSEFILEFEEHESDRLLKLAEAQDKARSEVVDELRRIVETTSPPYKGIPPTKALPLTPRQNRQCSLLRDEIH